LPTLILSARYTPDSNRLWQAAIQAGWTVERLHSHYAPEALQDEAVVLYGEGLFIRIIAEQLGVVLFETPYDWLPSLPSAYRKRDIELTTLGNARQLREPTFVKPAGDKSFDAQVYASGLELPRPETFDEATPTLISEPVDWDIEYRCFIAERQLRTCAPYLHAGHLMQDQAGEWLSSAPEDDEAVRFVNELIADDNVPLPPALVLDIGKMLGRGWAAIEANPAWASGLYGNDASAVLSVLRLACAPATAVADGLLKWVI
jgi:hypothetical protein